MQFKFFVSFFPSFFSLPDKEKAPHKMVTNHPIRCVVETYSVSRQIQGWGEELTNMMPEPLEERVTVGMDNLAEQKWRLATMQQRFRDVNSCRVTKIEHYRQGGNIAHECIILHISSPYDKRFVRLDRFKPNEESFTRSSGDLNIRPILSPSGTGNSDSVKISDTLEGDLLRKDSYDLVQSVQLLPTETLTVVHCAAIGASITNAAKDYSALNHMCMWWAAMFFSTAYRFLASTQPIEPGSVYEEAGKIYGIRFVKPDARLVAFTQRDTDTVVKHAKEDSQSLLADAVKSDVEKLKSSRLVIDDIVSSSKAKEKEMRAAMEKQLEDQKAKIANVVAHEANRAAELAARDAAIAESNAKLAAAVAERDAIAANREESDAKHAAELADRDAKHAAEVADLTNQLKSAGGQGSGRRS